MIRPPRVSDAKMMHDAMQASFSTLKKWMPWAQSLASLRDTIVYLEEGEQIWQNLPREGVEQPLQIVTLSDDQYIGATGIKPANLLVPSFEVGYWVNQPFSGKGLISEAVNALTRYLFLQLQAKRVEINCEENNMKSANVVERIHYDLEGKLKNHRLTADSSSVTHSLIYACTDLSCLPDLEWTFEQED